MALQPAYSTPASSAKKEPLRFKETVILNDETDRESVRKRNRRGRRKPDLPYFKS